MKFVTNELAKALYLHPGHLVDVQSPSRFKDKNPA